MVHLWFAGTVPNLFIKLRMSWKELKIMGPKHDIYLSPDENQCLYKKYGTGAHGSRTNNSLKG